MKKKKIGIRIRIKMIRIRNTVFFRDPYCTYDKAIPPNTVLYINSDIHPCLLPV